ncbi:hypothetical protein PM082_014665 [Marasmius tenuissimus]|nr:hypothetical protein PM082_014665 [Marasmius tenuissimus]
MHANRTSPANNKEPGVAHCLGRCANYNFDIEAFQKTIRGPSQTVYHHYSRNNAYPSPLELAPIKAELEEATSTLSAITDIVAHLKAEIDALEAERSRISQVILDYKSILRPIHRLPPELLERVFSFSVDIPELYDSLGYREQTQSSLDPRKSPWTLAQVCQSFRNMALATPSLWSFISFGFLGPTSTANPEYLAHLRAHNHRLRLQLQRSSDLPLTIMTHTPDDMTSIDRSLFQLCSHTDRWRSLRIELHSSSSEELSQIRGSLPNIESLDIHCPGSGIEEIDYFEFATRLKKLVLSGNCELTRSLSGAPMLPLSQITDYTYYDGLDVNASTVWGLVYRHFIWIRHNVEKLRLFLHSRPIEKFHTMRVERPDLERIQTFHRLTELELHSTELGGPMETGIDELLYWIEAPLLTKLTVTTLGDPTALLKSLSQPETLISLTIHQVIMSSEEFSSILGRLRSLRDLRFGVEGGIGNAHLSLLLPESPTHSFSIVPALQKLALLPVPGSKSSYSVHILLDMLEARRRALESPSLQSIRLDRRLESELAKARLDQLQEEGLQVLEL